MKAETAIVASIVEAVNRSGEAHVWRNNSGSVPARGGYVHLAPAGTPDIVGWTRDGKFCGFEVKVPGAKTSAERAARQAETRDRIRAAGGVSAEVTGAIDAIRVLRDATARAS